MRKSIWREPIRLVVDPVGCGCTDCILGDSVPLEFVTASTYHDLWPWEIIDRT